MPAAVLGHVRHAEIVCEEQIDERNYGERNDGEYQNARVSRGAREKRAVAGNPDNPDEKCIACREERNKQCHRTDYVHEPPPPLVKSIFPLRPAQIPGLGSRLAKAIRARE
jgi:hypothetical protein